MTPAGFPHSEIHGSKRVCRSPWLIAACRVLHRRLAPRHPPFTLSSLAIKYFRRESYKIFAFQNLLITRFCCQRPIFASALLIPFLGRGGGPGEPGRGFSPKQVGGADRDRTDDLRLAKPPLSQLSYSPDSRHRWLQAFGSLRAWWAWIDLNYRPHAYQACALTS